jgi:hypothetical protein
MRGLAAFACAALLICLGILPSQAEKRVALVIGNSAYPGRAALSNPVNDAADVTSALRGIGFEVVSGTDLALGGFAQVIDSFHAKAKGADVALVYYAGHAMQFDEQNWLMPVDTRLASTFEVRHYNVALQDLISEIEREARTTLVFLDACRDNPLDDALKAKLNIQGRGYGDARGLARIDIKAPDTLVVFATRPNTTASDGKDRRNSPFTEAFLENLSAPGVEIEVLMKRVTASVAAKTQNKQEPERLSRLKSEFYFVPSSPGPAAAKFDSVAPAPSLPRVPRLPSVGAVTSAPPVATTPSAPAPLKADSAARAASRPGIPRLPEIGSAAPAPAATAAPKTLAQPKLGSAPPAASTPTTPRLPDIGGAAPETAKPALPSQ